MAKKKEREIVVDFVKDKVKKRKTEMEEEKYYGYGKVGHFITNCLVIICFSCNGEGHQALECPWNPKGRTTKMAMPSVRWALMKKPRIEVRKQVMAAT